MKSNGTEAPLVSVAIITRNSKDDLRLLLNSLEKPLSNTPGEIIIIDNASTDSTSQMIKSEFPDVLMTINSRNRGVAPARNQALKQCSGKFVLILDSDCEYRDGKLHDAIQYLDANPDVGVLGFRVYYPSGELQDTARTLPAPSDILINRLDHSEKVRQSIVFRRHRMRDFDPMKIREAGFVAGACQFFRRQLLDEIGYLDENMFYGYEDSDFCARAISKEKKIVYFPYISVVHHHRRLTKKSPFSRMTLIQIRSYMIFYKKHGRLINGINERLFSKK